MVLVTGSWKMWLVGLAASLAIFGVLYFTVIKPNSDTANQAVKQGMQQTQQAINQAQKQLNSASSSSAGSATAQTKAATGTAQQTLTKAAKLTQCVSAAGTDATKLQACQVKFAH
jgi:hypothetical protein